MLLTKQQAHERWATADHDAYALEGQERTAYLVELVIGYKPLVPATRILEIGCNVGRNLNGLLQAGYEDLTGMDINQNVHKHMKEHYPEVYQKSFYFGPLEFFLTLDPPPFKSLFDVVYTMAVMEHIHPDSEWVFEKIPDLLDKGGYLILIEDELNEDGLDFVYPRCYRNLFPQLTLVHEEDSSHVPGLKKGYKTYVFQKP